MAISTNNSSIRFSWIFICLLSINRKSKTFLWKKEEKRDDIAIIRLEQLYPLPEKQIRELLEKKYTGAMEICWVQEEPVNMGAWRHVSFSLPDIPFRLISRRRAASPATGFKKRHDEEKEIIVSVAFEKK